MSEEKNKVRFGLKNCYYAKATVGSDGNITFDTPKRLPGAVSLAMDPEGKNEPFYADDCVYYVTSGNTGYSGDIEIALIPDEFKQDCMGEVADKKNVIMENASATISPFALLFEFDGDKKKTRHVMYNCTAERSSVEGETTEDSKKPKAEKMKLSAAPIPATGVVKARTNEKTDPQVYENWFTKVYTKDGEES